MLQMQVQVDYTSTDGVPMEGIWTRKFIYFGSKQTFDELLWKTVVSAWTQKSTYSKDWLCLFYSTKQKHMKPSNSK